MGSQEALLAGVSIGLAVAAPIGPMAVIVIRRTLTAGFLAGITSAAGASTIHLLYATLALCGVDWMATYVEGNRKLINAIVALVLVGFALKMLRRQTARTSPGPPMRQSLIGSYASAIMFSLVNPMSFALLLSAIAAIAGLSAHDIGQTTSLAVGVFAGSIAWWMCLVGVTAFIGNRLSPRSMRMIDIVAGIVMVAMAVSAVSRFV